MHIIPESTDIITAVSTPSGTGAIAVIRMSGKHSFEIANEVFRTPDRQTDINTFHSHRVHFGSLYNEEGHLDDVLLALFRAPNSYTGEDTVEISCHGSSFIQQKILQLLVKKGARIAAPGEFTLRAFLNGKMDLLQAEAVADLIASHSETQHRTALRQLKGGVSGKIRILREKLIHFASLVELELDFSEEDVEFAGRTELFTLVSEIRNEIRTLTDSFNTGNAIKNGIPVVIAGKPNVGKSTLLNVLLNEDRAIVSEIPGTTRDVIEDEITLGGMIFRFMDTAGIRDTHEVIEAAGVKRTLEKIRSSAVVLYVFDVHEMSRNELQNAITDISNLSAGHDCYLMPVGNKIDRENPEDVKKEFAGIENLVFISARERLNIPLLQEKLLQAIFINSIAAGATVISSVRQWEALSHAGEALKRVEDGVHQNISKELVAADLRVALHHLDLVTGHISSDDVLSEIFGRFCIGK